jgi:hypothetical protein
MEANLKFNLNDSDDNREFKNISRINDILLFLWDYRQWIRDSLRYNPDQYPDGVLEGIEKASEKFYEMAGDADLLNTIND